MKLSQQNNHIRFGTENGLMFYLFIYQQIYQAKQLAHFLFTTIMLKYIHSQLTQHF